jgi:hypothetical protein
LQHQAGLLVRLGFQPVTGAPNDPNTRAYLWSFPSPSSPVASRLVLPVVLYRQLIADARGSIGLSDIVQVTPLVKNIAWRSRNRTESLDGLENGQTYSFTQTVIVDPLWRAAIRTTVDGSKFADLYLTDPHPVAEDSTYRYYIVQFRADGEIDQIIRAGDVTIPAITE